MDSLVWEVPFRGMRATEHPPAPALSRSGLTWVLTPENESLWVFQIVEST